MKKKLILDKTTVKQIKIKTDVKTGAPNRSGSAGSGTITGAGC